LLNGSIISPGAAQRPAFGWTRRALSAVRNYVKDVPRLSLRPDIVVTHGPPVAPLYNPAEEPF